MSNYTRDLSAARSSFEKALIIARELKDDWLVADLLRSLGAVIYRSDASAARPFLEESLTLARKLGEPWLLVWVLMNSGLAAETQGQHEQARVFIEESVPWCRKMKDKEVLANALEGLSILLLVQGEIEKAEANLCESLALAVEIESQEAIGTSLVQLGGVAASRGQAKRAVYLLGAGESILNAHGLSTSVWPIELAAYNRYVASIRTQLDEATFNIIWDEGCKMTMEQAIALALEPAEEITESAKEIEIVLDRLPSRREAAKQKYGGLTTREREVAVQVAQGKSNQAIAAELFLSLKTVEAHITRILSKLGFTSRAQIAGWAVAKGLAEPPRDLDTLGKEGS